MLKKVLKNQEKKQKIDLDFNKVMDEINFDDADELLGLDEEDEPNNVYIKDKKNYTYVFEKEHLKFIKLIDTILKSDNSAGSQENPIKLPLLDNDIFDLIITYIKKHGKDDYQAKDNSNGPDILYTERMSLWDRNFINEIALEDRKNGTDILGKLLDASAYLMYNTLYSKICCFLANTESSNDYKNIFRQLKIHLDNRV